MTDWRCFTCNAPADYRSNNRNYCSQHWNYGEPIMSEARKKQLKDLTDKERELLISMGMMWELYPEADEFGRAA